VVEKEDREHKNKGEKDFDTAILSCSFRRKENVRKAKKESDKVKQPIISAGIAESPEDLNIFVIGN